MIVKQQWIAHNWYIQLATPSQSTAFHRDLGPGPGPRIFRPGPAFQGSGETVPENGGREVYIQWMAMSSANSWVFQGGILEMFFQHIWKMISELLLYWIYTNSSNQFKPRVFLLPETRRGCCGPSQNLEMNGPGIKKNDRDMIGHGFIWK